MSNVETGPGAGIPVDPPTGVDGGPAEGMQAGEAKAIAGAPLEALAEGIGSILQHNVHEFMRWGEGFMNWATAQQMNGFQVPIEAYADYRGRLGWLLSFLEQFTEPAAILRAGGQERPAALLADYLKGLQGLKARLEATLGAMQADNFATEKGIRQIGEQMFDTNVQAAATRLGIQRGGDAATAGIHAATQQRRQQSFDSQVGRMPEHVSLRSGSSASI